MTLKRYKPLARISEKRRSTLADIKSRQDADAEFYQQIWLERCGICEVTHESLGTEPLKTMFHHILPKSKYPQYRYCKWNILMVKPEVHSQIELDINKVPLAREIYLRLIDKLT